MHRPRVSMKSSSKRKNQCHGPEAGDCLAYWRRRGGQCGWIEFVCSLGSQRVDLSVCAVHAGKPFIRRGIK